jgi:glucosyl-3-phosphoglycerate synthase
MSDFFQVGVVATFHRFGRQTLEKIEEELSWFAHDRPIALVLPCLYKELAGSALKGIIRQLKEVRYIREIVVSLGNASPEEFRHAREYFSGLPQETSLIWLEGPRISEVFDNIRQTGLPVGEGGKGRAAWMACGYVLARQEFHTIALHDCDVVTYNREMLARLCYPIANANLNYAFCKGFYSRVTDRMHGRVTRLLFTTLIRSLQKMLGYHPLLVFFDSFRYALAGEFSMDVDLARIIRIPGDWGLEVGMLAEVYRNSSLRRVCQIDIIDNYEHRHQELSPDDASKGLHKMSVDICKSIFRTLASEGIVFSEGFFKTLIATYVNKSQEMLKRYEDDAAVNGLIFDRHAENLAVETFTDGIRKAADKIFEDPLGVPLISSWDRVTSAIPDILERIEKAVREDNKS